MLVIKSELSKAALRFIEALNSHNIGVISTLITPDAAFNEILGKKIKGKEDITGALEKLFKIFPEFFIRINEVFENKNSIVLIGIAVMAAEFSPGTKPKRIKIKSALHIEVKGGKINSCTVYADAIKVYRILDAGKSI